MFLPFNDLIISVYYTTFKNKVETLQFSQRGRHVIDTQLRIIL